MRAIANFDTGFPNMTGAVTPEAATIAEILQREGFSTFATGKWHLAPTRDCSPAGPFTHWPLGRGFDRYYGFLQGETDQFHPELCHDNHFIDPPLPAEDGYHVSVDMVDQAMRMIRNSISVVPEKPIFSYVAFGAMHSPHQAPDEYLQRWRGKFDEGWDVFRERVYRRQLGEGIIPRETQLAPRNPGVKPWDELSDDERVFAARLQEAFAAFLEHTDDQIGRFTDFLDQTGRLDNTIFVLLSDNGASQEGLSTGVFDEFRYFNGFPEDVSEAVKRLDDIGTIRSHCNYPWGWAMVGNTPNKWYKQNTHGGGVRDPLIVHWPAGIPLSEQGSVRQQFHHAVDITPTLLDLLGIDPPASVKGVAQMSMHGVSMRRSIEAAAAPSNHATQYFEMAGCRGIYHDGWKAVTHHQRESDNSYPDSEWELYHLDKDFSECDDLAEQQPDKLRKMIDLFDAEATLYGVYPLDDRLRGLFSPSPRRGTPNAREKYVYLPPIDHLITDVSPPLGSRSWDMLFDLSRASESDSGALLAVGTPNSGHVAYILDNRLVYDVNFFGEHQIVRSNELPAGRHILGLHLERVRRGPGHMRFSLDGDPVGGGGAIEYFAVMISSSGLDLGRNPSSISPEYDGSFSFVGELHRVEIDVRRPGDAESAHNEALIAGRTEAGRD
jgi:arylsulfatase